MVADSCSPRGDGPYQFIAGSLRGECFPPSRGQTTGKSLAGLRRRLRDWRAGMGWRSSGPSPLSGMPPGSETDP